MDEIVALMELGLIVLLLVYVVCFPLSPLAVRIGLAATMIPPIFGIVVIDLYRDLYHETPLKLRGPGGMAAVCFVGSLALLLVAWFS